jgi:hypothetical protein
MSGQAWSVTIVPGSPCARFEVDAYGQSGSDLQAENGDIVSWNNQTNDEHQPVVAPTVPGGDPTPLCDVIGGFESSTPGYIVGSTVAYYCKFHEAETGSITVVS